MTVLKSLIVWLERRWVLNGKISCTYPTCREDFVSVCLYGEELLVIPLYCPPLIMAIELNGRRRAHPLLSTTKTPQNCSNHEELIDTSIREALTMGVVSEALADTLSNVPPLSVDVKKSNGKHRLIFNAMFINDYMLVQKIQVFSTSQGRSGDFRSIPVGIRLGYLSRVLPYWNSSWILSLLGLFLERKVLLLVVLSFWSVLSLGLGCGTVYYSLF